MSALRFEGVRVHLDGRPVLDGVDLDLEAGEVLVLGGRNGAGKTTLLRVATALLAPEAGRVWLGDRPLASFRRRELAQNIALVPQETAIAFPFRVGELVLMGRTPHLGWLGFETRDDIAAARHALERLGIADLADRPLPELSGGERQLVLVARALAQDAPILLLDEPTAHLDLARRLQILELVRELAAEGRSALVVSHDLGLTARYGNRVALLADGRILAAGTPEATLTPERLRTTFHVEARVVQTEAGPVVVPERAAPPPSR